METSKAMTMGGERERVHILRPHGHLFRQWSITILAFCLPLFAVLYWLAIPAGTWLGIGAANGIAALIWIIGAIAFRRVSIRVSPLSVTERPFIGRSRTIPGAAIRSALLIDVYESAGLETSPQLFLIDDRGSVLLRMRGRYWACAAMEAVTDVLGVPATKVDQPMTMQELNRMRPDLLYWFERRLAGRS